MRLLWSPISATATSSNVINTQRQWTITHLLTCPSRATDHYRGNETSKSLCWKSLKQINFGHQQKTAVRKVCNVHYEHNSHGPSLFVFGPAFYAPHLALWRGAKSPHTIDSLWNSVVRGRVSCTAECSLFLLTERHTRKLASTVCTLHYATQPAENRMLASN